jgi:hypothetical protein
VRVQVAHLNASRAQQAKWEAQIALARTSAASPAANGSDHVEDDSWSVS